jgi:hypothetical protein
MNTCKTPLYKTAPHCPLLVIFVSDYSTFISIRLNEGCAVESCLVGGIFWKHFSETLNISSSISEYSARY